MLALLIQSSSIIQNTQNLPRNNIKVILTGYLPVKNKLRVVIWINISNHSVNNYTLFKLNYPLTANFVIRNT